MSKCLQKIITQHYEITTNFVRIVFAVLFSVAFITRNSKLYFYIKPYMYRCNECNGQPKKLTDLSGIQLPELQVYFSG